MTTAPGRDQTRSATAELAAFLVDTTVDDRLRARAVDGLVDTAGAIVHGAGQPWSAAVIAHVDATGGDGPCTVVGGRSTAPALAALANGASAHAFELDDVHEEAISHPGAVVVPAALAIGEHVDASGHDLLEAIVVGYEAMGRAGIAVGPAAHMLAGFHPTSMSGVFGAAAAAGRLLGLDAATLNHAFGIAVSLASGTMEFAASGGMAKRLHAGRAAEGGVTAALLAARGFEGAADGLAGRYGFCHAFGPEPHPERLTSELGDRWMIDEITVKPWAACSDIHPLIQAALELRADGLAVDRITRIEARAPTKAATQNTLDGTTSVMAAQYSAQWNVAAALVADPADPATYHPDRIADPAIARLQELVVSVEADAVFDATYAWRMGGALRVELDDGSVDERTVHGQRGSMHDPLSSREIDAKFLALAGRRVPVDALTCLRGVGERRVLAAGRALGGGNRG